MAKHIGIVAVSSEGAALCFRTICLEGAAIMGRHAHPEISMHCIPLSDYMEPAAHGDWDAVGVLMSTSAKKLAALGVDLLICPDNTVHEAFEFAEACLDLPWLHIADVVAEEARRRDFRRLAVLGTRYLMEGPVYPSRLEPRGIDHRIPDGDERDRIDTIIFDELVAGTIDERSRQTFVAIIDRLREEEGCDAVVLGCTEIPLLIDDRVSPLPTLDSTRLLARAALHEATRGHAF